MRRLVTPLSLLLVPSSYNYHAKKFQGHKQRTKHSRQWWLKSKSSALGAAPLEDRSGKQLTYPQDVDRPYVMPEKVDCFQCQKPIDHKGNPPFVWIPAGNATVPTPMGYFFHVNCFRCAQCRFRIFHNRFVSVNGKAICCNCALGRSPVVPVRRWHIPYVNPHLVGSLRTGHNFPRFKSQLEFMYDPKEWKKSVGIKKGSYVLW